jgi:hypothetical protein
VTSARGVLGLAEAAKITLPHISGRSADRAAPDGLLSLLFDDPALQKWVRDYLIF